MNNDTDTMTTEITNDAGNAGNVETSPPRALRPCPPANTAGRDFDKELGERQSQKIANNTYVERRGENIAVRLHATDVLTFRPDGSIYVQTGGWETPTTKERINRYLRVDSIYQRNGEWYWSRASVQFEDGDEFDFQGRLSRLATSAYAES